MIWWQQVILIICYIVIGFIILMGLIAIIFFDW